MSLASVASVTAAENKCSFLPANEGPPFSVQLPVGVLSHPLSDFPLEFRGISPIVTRAPLAFGETPRVTIQRYSQRPDVFYDSAENRVVFSAATCGDTGRHTGTKSATENRGYKEEETMSAATSGASTTSSRLWMWSTTALITALLGRHSSSASSSVVMAFGALLLTGFAGSASVVQAQDLHDDCEPVVQILVQAPAAYKGAVEICLEEIDDTAICPDPFPTYPTCNDPSPTCEVAVVGAGAGGLYAALRMVDEGVVDASDVCVFEMTERVGGRLMSLRGLGPEDNLVIDAGGYRTWPEFTPTAHALITEYLGIPMGCYDDSDPCQVYNIVDENGTKAGFTLFVEEMMQRLSDGGACFYPFHELKSIDRLVNFDVLGEAVVARQDAGVSVNTSAVTELYFSNGVNATAKLATILNVPQRPLLNIVRDSHFDDKGMLDAATLDALHSVQTVIATKLYLYYPRGHVFWHKLGLFSGDFEHEGDARNMLLAGRYHDGQVECDDPEDLDTCHGFLLAVYANDLSGNKAQYFRRYQRDRPEPVTIISNQDLEGREFLRHAHNQLMDYHLLYKRDAPYTGFQASQILANIQAPTWAVLSTWNTAIPWAGGAWHAWTDTSNIDLAKQPFVHDEIYVINEAFSLMHGWAEGSIKVADEVLQDHFGIARPWNFTVVDLNQIVRQTDSQECTATDTAQAQADTSRGADDGAAALLCFTGDAMVSMADGSFKAIGSVEVGDEVLTGGPNAQVGVVTETLYHPVNRQVPVAKLMTESHGELVGTPDHPVLHENEWVEFGLLPGETVVIKEQFVDAFYNLEIDGHLLDESLHSYMVHGMVASGLGDNPALNMRYPRQKEWKILAAGVNGIAGAAA
ncbi:Flavin containing amine oxidoreductase [Seminavis robusta]|uniref:Flavin containing amine oxidoreductase n=1 Tax=Seminavis robusta TaxID=568900 RepID=A0A9N8H4L2_9STRA|nr:Flavin containing amine oxidoreductase [Seminavis robusta]|eukprot:Sro53_g031360.1 Flavin containing amine oxidoreductase (862) ;mRNA; f:54110-56989